VGYGGDSEGNHWVDLAIIAVLWIYFPVSGNWNPMGFGVEGYGLFFLNPTAIFNTFPIWFLSIIFAAQVIRHYAEDIPRKNIILLGYISIIPPAILGFMGLIPVVQSSIFFYVGPIPITFLVGYILLRYSSKLKTGKESDQEVAESWLDEEGTQK